MSYEKKFCIGDLVRHKLDGRKGIVIERGERIKPRWSAGGVGGYSWWGYKVRFAVPEIALAASKTAIASASGGGGLFSGADGKANASAETEIYVDTHCSEPELEKWTE